MNSYELLYLLLFLEWLPSSTESCGEMEFSCSSSRCIPVSWLCDGKTDCEDGIDEHHRHCHNNHRRNSSCMGNEIECLYGGSWRCIQHQWLCDGHLDCDDRSDEENCGETIVSQFSICGLAEAPCASGGCIPKNLLCDGIADCMDGSDERCLEEGSSTLPTLFSGATTGGNIIESLGSISEFGSLKPLLPSEGITPLTTAESPINSVVTENPKTSQAIEGDSIGELVPNYVTFPSTIEDLPKETVFPMIIGTEEESSTSIVMLENVATEENNLVISEVPTITPLKITTEIFEPLESITESTTEATTEKFTSTVEDNSRTIGETITEITTEKTNESSKTDSDVNFAGSNSPFGQQTVQEEYVVTSTEALPMNESAPFKVLSETIGATEEPPGVIEVVRPIGASEKPIETEKQPTETLKIAETVIEPSETLPSNIEKLQNPFDSTSSTPSDPKISEREPVKAFILPLPPWLRKQIQSPNPASPTIILPVPYSVATLPPDLVSTRRVHRTNVAFPPTLSPEQRLEYTLSPVNATVQNGIQAFLYKFFHPQKVDVSQLEPVKMKKMEPIVPVNMNETVVKEMNTTETL